jgi:phage N-6-adenine-methyltransferase
MPTETADTWEDLVNDGIEARKQGDGANWLLGDLAGRVETTYGAGDLQKYADRVGTGYKSLLQYRWVAERFFNRLEHLTWTHHMVVAARDDAEALLARAEREGLTVGQLRALVKGVAHVSHNSGENEWYTPAEFVEAARLVLGEIDLDPASSEAANEIVQAREFFTAEDDGLAQEWRGRVWMNPPYAAELIGQFTEKLAAAYEGRDVSAAVILVNNATETKWFQRLARIADALCFPERRVRFWNPDGESSAPLQGQALIYLGNDADAFAEHFAQFGLIVEVRAG